MLIGAYSYFWYRKDWLKLTVRQNDPPVLGEYDNTLHGEVIDKQLEMVKQSGIDFLSLSWDYRYDHGHVIDALKKTNTKATYFYESLHRERDSRGKVPPSVLPLILNDMDLIKELTSEDCWLHIDSRPVVMIYVTRAYADPVNALKAIRKRFNDDVFLVGDELWWDPLNIESLKQLDAVTGYNFYCPGRFSTVSPEETASTYLNNIKTQMQKHVSVCASIGLPVWGNSLPGYNDRGVRGDKNHHPIPRLGGDFFKRSLADAFEVSTGKEKCIMITSFNEHYEDSGIESFQSDNGLYLNILKEFKENNNVHGN